MDNAGKAPSNSETNMNIHILSLLEWVCKEKSEISTLSRWKSSLQSGSPLIVIAQVDPTPTSVSHSRFVSLCRCVFKSLLSTLLLLYPDPLHLYFLSPICFLFFFIFPQFPNAKAFASWPEHIRTSLTLDLHYAEYILEMLSWVSMALTPGTGDPGLNRGVFLALWAFLALYLGRCI